MKYKDRNDINSITSELLMPKVIISALHEKFLRLNELEFHDILNAEQKDKLYTFISEKLKVSKMMVSFRLVKLGII